MIRKVVLLCRLPRCPLGLRQGRLSGQGDGGLLTVKDADGTERVIGYRKVEPSRNAQRPLSGKCSIGSKIESFCGTYFRCIPMTLMTRSRTEPTTRGSGRSVRNS